MICGIVEKSRVIGEKVFKEMTIFQDDDKRGSSHAHPSKFKEIHTHSIAGHMGQKSPGLPSRIHEKEMHM